MVKYGYKPGGVAVGSTVTEGGICTVCGVCIIFVVGGLQGQVVSWWVIILAGYWYGYCGLCGTYDIFICYGFIGK